MKAESKILPNPYLIANLISLEGKTYNGYRYLIQALLALIPDLHQHDDDDVIHFHHHIRSILVDKYRLKYRSALQKNRQHIQQMETAIN